MFLSDCCQGSAELLVRHSICEVFRETIACKLLQELHMGCAGKLLHELQLFKVVAARALATYLIPGCVGRGVRLGSENSSGAGAAGAAGAGGGVWKSGGHFSEKKKAPAATYPQVQGFQKYGGYFSGKTKSACGNVPTSSGLPEIWDP